jgi:putative transposase
MYRILAAAGQNGERRRQATHPAKTVPQLLATAPGQVLTWDITKLQGPDKGEWYHAYVIIDISAATSAAGPSSALKQRNEQRS